MKYIKLLLMLVITGSVISCNKTYDAEFTYAKPAIAATWAKSEPFYSPRSERFDETTNTWRTFIAFTITSTGEPDKIGYANPYTAGRGTNPLDMNRLYTAQSLTTNAGFYNITIPKCFQFIPDEGSTQTGTVVVLPQKVRIFRRDESSFEIGISPGTNPGTYNLTTGIFEIEVSFDETSIAGPADIKRRYRFTAQ